MSKILPWHNGVVADDVNSDITFTVPVHFEQGAFGSFGAVWFVSPTGLNTSGKSLEHAFNSIQDAVDAASAGDSIFVQPGTYEENVVITTDYLKLVGIETGYGRPDLAPASGVPLTVTAQGFVCSRIRFAADGDDACIQEGNGFLYDDCVFDGDGTAAKCCLRLKGNADDDSFTASEGTVQNSYIRGGVNGISFDTGDAPGNGVGCTDNVIKKCRFSANTKDITTLDTGGGTYSVKTTLIKDCEFLDKNKAVYIDLTTANGGAASDQTGSIMGCYFATDSITDTNIAMVGTGFTLVGCYDTVGIEDGSDQDD